VIRLETEYRWQSVVIDYRPAVALTVERRLGSDREAYPALATLAFVVDLLDRLTIDGEPLGIGRYDLRLSTVSVIRDLLSEITEHATAWSKRNEAKTEENSA
jgi:hypothetical protein